MKVWVMYVSQAEIYDNASDVCKSQAESVGRICISQAESVGRICI